MTGPALDWLDGFVARRAANPEQAALLRLAVDQGREQAADVPGGLPAAELPLLAYAAAGGGDPPPLALAGVCLCVYLGADVFDNVADGELPPRWLAVGPGRASLAGATLLAAFAGLAIDEIEADPAVRLALHRSLSRALAAMAAGQAADLAFEGRDDVTFEACEAMVRAKSGAELAFFAEAGAILAGASAPARRAYADLGRYLGTGGQIASDCADLFGGGAEGGRDLAAGKRTLPIVHALATMTGADRAALLADLEAAPHDPERARAAHRLLLAAGGLELGALVADAYRRRASTALAATGATGPAATRLGAYIDAAAIFGRRPTTTGDD